MADERPQPPRLTLSNVAEGAAEDIFQAALGEVLTNIADPNTEAKAIRKINLEFLVSVDEDRRLGEVKVRYSTKLAGRRAVTGGFFLGRDRGALKAIPTPSQDDMFPNPNPKPVAVPPAAAGS